MSKLMRFNVVFFDITRAACAKIAPSNGSKAIAGGIF